MVIRIARMVRVTLSDTELQTLRPGEFYDVPPAVGRVLVSDGWAEEPEPEVVEEDLVLIPVANSEPSPPRSS